MVLWCDETRELTFGTGTKLTVEPDESKPAHPSVFTLKPQKGDSPVACLAKDFIPKELSIYMNSTQGDSQTSSPSTVVSPNGKYSAVYVNRLGTQKLQCLAKHQEEWVSDVDSSSGDTGTYTDPTEPSRTKDQEVKCEQTTTPAKPALTNEKINILSATVLGLRLLFVKTLAFNLLLTVKFFLL